MMMPFVKRGVRALFLLFCFIVWLRKDGFCLSLLPLGSFLVISCLQSSHAHTPLLISGLTPVTNLVFH
jgi:hypothetical protein